MSTDVVGVVSNLESDHRPVGHFDQTPILLKLKSKLILVGTVTKKTDGKLFRHDLFLNELKNEVNIKEGH